ncbi:MAG: DUF5691 domain-containing protein [Alphaproteobacteria bacterium]|nr:DUF5691 domain-containing protein [Alphaproteobacteria bacterium]
MAEAHSPEDTLDCLGAVLARWATGGSAAAVAPAAWVDLLGSDPTEAELRLLALSGQLLESAIALPTTERGALALRTLPDLPRLAPGTVPDRFRPVLRRLQHDSNGADWACLLHLLAARGFTVHPADWLPAADNSELPDVYAPWRDWAAMAHGAATSRGREIDEINIETWDLFYPAERCAALKALRRLDPEAARALLEAKLAGEDAAKRLALVECLSIGLSPTDLPLLQTLATSDRAPRVKAQAVQYLARLGAAPTSATSNDDAAELADYFSTGLKGGFKLKPLKTTAQKNRRAQLLSNTDFASFAASLQFSPLELAQNWPFASDAQLDQVLAEMAQRSAPDDIIAVLARHAIGNVQTCIALASRLEPQARVEIARYLLDRSQTFQVAVEVAGAAFHGDRDSGLDHPLSLPAGVRLMGELRLVRSLEARNDDKSDSQAKAKRGALGDELTAIGLLASNAGARRTLDLLRAADLLNTICGLTDMIELNADLPANTGNP